MDLYTNYLLIIEAIQNLEGVLAIGKSGGEKIPARNESDIDVFVFCNHVPDAATRRDALAYSGANVEDIKVSGTRGAYWGFCDFISACGADICLMYFTVSDMDKEIESVLNGYRLDREKEYFYPTGRCASFLSMYILYDKTGYIAGVKAKLSVYPRSLSYKQYFHHSRKINDIEDFDRAVRRKDVLFYHATLENALDHYLQALFALNKRFFPGRKRTLNLVECFELIPMEFSARILKVVRLGAAPDTLEESYGIWKGLCEELVKFDI